MGERRQHRQGSGPATTAGRWSGFAAWLGVFALLLQTAVVPLHLAHDVAEEVGPLLAALHATADYHPQLDHPHHHQDFPGGEHAPGHPPHDDCFICLSVHFAGASPLPVLPPLPAIKIVHLRRPLPPAPSLLADGLRTVLPPSRAPPPAA